MQEARKYPVNLNVKLVLLVEPGEDGKYPSALDVQDAVREAVIEHFNHDLIDDATEHNLEEKAERARIDYSEITLHEEQPSAEETRAELITRRRAELVEAVLAKYPNADRLKVDITSDPNTRSYFVDDGWAVWCGQQQLGSFHDFTGAIQDGPFDQELNDYIDDAHITEDFTLNLKEQA